MLQFFKNRTDAKKRRTKKLIKSESFVKIGQMFNVSDNTIRKWCIKYNLPKTKRDIKKYSDEEWGKL